jgi:hypothetical protein
MMKEDHGEWWSCFIIHHSQFIIVLRCGLNALRQVLMLQAEGDKDMPQAVDRGLGEEFRRKVNREAGGVAAELTDQSRAVEAVYQFNQLLDLLALQHAILQLT